MPASSGTPPSPARAAPLALAAGRRRRQRAPGSYMAARGRGGAAHAPPAQRAVGARSCPGWVQVTASFSWPGESSPPHAPACPSQDEGQKRAGSAPPAAGPVPSPGRRRVGRGGRGPAPLRCGYSQKGFGQNLNFSRSKTEFLFSRYPCFQAVVARLVTFVTFSVGQLCVGRTARLALRLVPRSRERPR